MPSPSAVAAAEAVGFEPTDPASKGPTDFSGRADRPLRQAPIGCRYPDCMATSPPSATSEGLVAGGVGGRLAWAAPSERQLRMLAVSQMGHMT